MGRDVYVHRDPKKESFIVSAMDFCPPTVSFSFFVHDENGHGKLICQSVFMSF